jgi:hypothetical protein
VQHRSDTGRIEVRPLPAQVLAAGLGARDQLRAITDFRLPFRDRVQIVRLALRHHRQETNLPKAERVRRPLELLDAQPHDLRDRRAAVVATHDAAGDAGCARPERAALDEHDRRSRTISTQSPRERGRDR